MILWRAQRLKGANSVEVELNIEIEKFKYLNTIPEGIRTSSLEET
jgi:hypothetical protein